MARARTIVFSVLLSGATLVALLVVAALSPLGTGPLVRFAAERGAAAAGVTLHIGSVSGALWSDVHLEDVAVRRPDGTALTARHLTFGLDLVPLLSRRIRVAPLRVAGGSLRLPLRPPSAESKPPPPAENGWTVEVGDLAMHDAEIVLLHAPWIDRVLHLASIDTVSADSLVLSDVRVGEARVVIRLGQTATGEVAVSDVGATVTPLAAEARRLDATVVASDSMIDVRRLRLELAHGALEGSGRMYRRSGALSATVRIDSLHSADLGALAPPEAAGFSLSAEAAVGAGQPAGRWAVALTRSVLRDASNDGSIEATGVVQHTPTGRWPSVRGSVVVTGVTTGRVPGGDSLLPPGRIHGTLQLDGTGDVVGLVADLRLARANAVDSPEPVVTARGGLAIGGVLGFDSLRLVATTPLVLLEPWVPQRYLPAGVVTLDGMADGPLHDPRVRGIVRRRLTASAGVHDSVAFTIEPQTVRDVGRSAIDRNTDRPGPLHYAVEYGGRPGQVAVAGVVGRVDSAWGVDVTHFTAADLDLQAMLRDAPTSRITLSGEGRALIVDGAMTRLRATLRTDSSTIAGEPLVSDISGEWTPAMLVVESLTVATAGLSVRGQGRLRDGGTPDDTVALAVEVASMSDLTPLMSAIKGLVPALPDSAPSGTVAIDATITGAPSAPGAKFELQGRDLRFGGLGAARLAISGVVDSSRRGDAAIAIDTLRTGTRTVDRVTFDLSGGVDSARVGMTARHGHGQWVTAVEVTRAPSGRLVRIDSMLIGDSVRAWRARPGGSVFIGNDAIRIDSVVVEGAGGAVVVSGAASRTDTTAVVAGLRRVPLAALTSLVGTDSIAVAGTLSGIVRLEGPLGTPSGLVTVATDSTRVNGEPVADVILDLRVRSSGTDVFAALGRDSSLVVDGRVPMWIRGEPLRVALEEDGPLQLRVVVAGADLQRLRPLLVNVEDPRGEFSADVRLDGTWRDPDVSGTVALRNGRLSVPALGVAYDRIELAAGFEASRAVLDSLLFVTGDGWLRASGTVELAPLHDPTLRLSATAREFRAMQDDDFLTLTATGDLEIRGRLRAPEVSGRIGAPDAVLHFASLIDKSVVDLSDPLFAAVVDTTVLQRDVLEPGLMKRVRDSLVLDSVTVRLGSDVWLRSADANIQLDGTATVGKRADRYRVFGTFTARRGTYRLALGPAISREFRIVGGTVRYFGDPRTDAELDIDARHTVRSFRGEQVDVNAHIGGTIAEPEVTLSSSLGPQVSDSEIVSYLLFGAPSVQVFAGQRGRQDQTLFQRSAQQLADVLSGTLERSLTGSLGVPVDQLRIDPGEVSEGFSGAEIEIGKQLDLFGQPAFLTASPRLCPGQQLLSFRTTGVSLETWLADEWLMAMSLDPIQGCEATNVGTTGYSVGIDLFWEKH